MEEKEYTPQEVFGDNSHLDTTENGKAVTRSKVIGRALLLTACFLILIMAILYVLSLLKSGYGSFTVRVGEINSLTDKRLSISETKGFSNPTVYLEGIPVDEMDNITYEWLDVDEITSSDGSNNGDNYLAYTFYLKNVGTDSFTYDVSMNILSATKGTDGAVRVLLRRNGVDTIYAKEDKNGGTEVYPEGLVNFASEDVIFNYQEQPLKPNEIEKYSVIIWFEGEDPECVDDILKGVMKMEIAFEINE